MIVLYLIFVGITPILGTSVATIKNANPGTAGVIIGTRYLLIHPYSLELRPLEERQIRVGSQNNGHGGLLFDIKGYVQHPHYAPGYRRNKKWDNKDNIALLISKKDLPIGRDNVDKAKLPSPGVNPVGPGYLYHFNNKENVNYSKVNLQIHSKEECQHNHPAIDCERNLWVTTKACEIEGGAPVFSGDTLIGTVADASWCRKDGNKDVFVNNLQYYLKWINRTIKDENDFIA